MPRGRLRAFYLTAKSLCLKNWSKIISSIGAQVLWNRATCTWRHTSLSHILSITFLNLILLDVSNSSYVLSLSLNVAIHFRTIEKTDLFTSKLQVSNSPFSPSCRGSLPFSLRCLLAPSFWPAVPRLSCRWSFAQSTSKPLPSVSCNNWKRSCILIGSFHKLICPWKLWLFLRRFIHFRKSCYIIITIIVKLSGIYNEFGISEYWI